MINHHVAALLPQHEFIHIHNRVAIIEIVHPPDLDVTNVAGHGDFTALGKYFGVMETLFAGDVSPGSAVFDLGSQVLVQLAREDFKTGGVFLVRGVYDNSAPANAGSKHARIDPGG